MLELNNLDLIHNLQIDYLYRSYDKTVIVSKENTYYSYNTIKYIFNELFIKRFMTYDGYIKSIKKQNLSNKLVPILLDNNMLFIPFNNEGVLIYVNYYEIFEFKQNIIKFYGNNELNLKVSKYVYTNIINRVNYLLEYQSK